MMKLLYTLFSLLFIAGISCLGQDVKRPPQVVYMLRNNGDRVLTSDSADYIRVVSAPDSGSKYFVLHDYYKNGKTKFLGHTSNIVTVMLQGQGVSFYPNGRRKATAYYEYNLPSGPEYCYYPNGKLYMYKEHTLKKTSNYNHPFETDSLIKAAYDTSGKAIVEDGNGYYVKYDDNLKTIVEQGAVKDGKPDGKWKGVDQEYHVSFEEEYAGGKMVKGVSTDSTGNTATYQTRVAGDMYLAGPADFGRYLGTNVRYPAAAREKGIQGTVVLKLTINKLGKVENVKLLDALDPAIDAEALRVVRYMPAWKPRVVYGRPTPSVHMVPVTFTLGDGYITSF